MNKRKPIIKIAFLLNDLNFDLIFELLVNILLDQFDGDKNCFYDRFVISLY